MTDEQMQECKRVLDDLAHKYRFNDTMSNLLNIYPYRKPVFKLPDYTGKFIRGSFHE